MFLTMNQTDFEHLIINYVDIQVDPIHGFKIYTLKPRRKSTQNIDLTNKNAKYRAGVRVRTPLGEFKSVRAAAIAHDLNWVVINKLCESGEDGYEIIKGVKYEENKV